MDRELNVLVIGRHVPWPEDGGLYRRFAAVLRGLTAVGQVTYLALGSESITNVPGDLSAVRFVPAPIRSLPGRRVMLRMWRALATLGLPVRKPRNFALVTPVAGIDREAYDVVWVNTTGVHAAVADWLGDRATVVVDVNDWPGQWHGGDRFSLVTTLRSLPSRAAVRDINRALSNRLEDRRVRGLAGEVGALVASKLPADPPTNAHLVRNGYPAVPYTGGRPARRPPTLSFVAKFGYLPNDEAVGFLVRELLPELRKALPDGCAIRLVGTQGERHQSIAHEPEITITGYVPDLAAELSAADVCIVPLLHGTGTRLKIMEAWSHQVPVVSTTVGADGLGAVDGVHLLIADGPAEFAAACARLLGSEQLRGDLVRNAYDFLCSNFGMDAVAGDVRAALAAARRVGPQ